MRGHTNSTGAIQPFSPKLQSSLSSFSHTLSPSSTGLILAGRNSKIAGLIQPFSPKLKSSLPSSSSMFSPKLQSSLYSF